MLWDRPWTASSPEPTRHPRRRSSGRMRSERRHGGVAIALSSLLNSPSNTPALRTNHTNHKQRSDAATSTTSGLLARADTSGVSANGCLRLREDRAERDVNAMLTMGADGRADQRRTDERLDDRAEAELRVDMHVIAV